MKKRIFLRIPVVGEVTFFSVAEKEWKKNLSCIYPALSDNERKCDTVARVKTRVGGPLGPVRYMWVDESAHVYRRSINWRLLKKAYPGLLTGPVLIELGVYDLTDATDAAKWDKDMARIGPNPWGIKIPDRVEA